MKSFLEKLKDLLYDGIDYIVMILVIAGVALIINWRLGGLFAKDSTTALGQVPSNIEKNEHVVPENDDSKDEVLDENPEENIDNDENSHDDKANADTMVQINIPAGSLPSKIGEILESNGLVEDKSQFVQKAIDLKLETKLKYGEFEIAKNSSMEDILAILTK